MFPAFTAVGAILMIFAFFCSLSTLTPDKYEVVNWSIFYLEIALFAFGFGLFAISFIQVMKNNFYELRASVEETRANIGVLQKQYNDLVEKLEALVQKYFSHETSLLDAVKGRSTGNLTALLENYPELKAMGGTKELIGKIVGLRGEISDAEKQYNEKVREYNEYSQKSPYNNFLPKGLEKRYEYISPDSK